MYQTKHYHTIQEFFEQNQKEAFTAKHIYDLFKDTINKATIYRKLSILEAEKVIRKIYHLPTNSYVYQYCQKECANHLHLICEKCGKTIHLDCPETMDFVNHILVDHQFIIHPYETNLYGICKECSCE